MSSDPALAQPYIAAPRRLVAQGAVAIGSSCGFAIGYQLAVAGAADVLL
ncbi:hypothetical protein [Bradyrhizobium sp. 136]|nr:hypothetical protein [Bradyrhizobium sp. 136]